MARDRTYRVERYQTQEPEEPTVEQIIEFVRAVKDYDEPIDKYFRDMVIAAFCTVFEDNGLGQYYGKYAFYLFDPMTSKAFYVKRGQGYLSTAADANAAASELDTNLWNNLSEEIRTLSNFIHLKYPIQKILLYSAIDLLNDNPLPGSPPESVVDWTFINEYFGFQYDTYTLDSEYNHHCDNAGTDFATNSNRWLYNDARDTIKSELRNRGIAASAKDILLQSGLMTRQRLVPVPIEDPLDNNFLQPERGTWTKRPDYLGTIGFTYHTGTYMGYFGRLGFILPDNFTIAQNETLLWHENNKDARNFVLLKYAHEANIPLVMRNRVNYTVFKNKWLLDVVQGGGSVTGKAKIYEEGVYLKHCYFAYPIVENISFRIDPVSNEGVLFPPMKRIQTTRVQKWNTLYVADSVRFNDNTKYLIYDFYEVFPTRKHLNHVAWITLQLDKRVEYQKIVNVLIDILQLALTYRYVKKMKNLKEALQASNQALSTSQTAHSRLSHNVLKKQLGWRYNSLTKEYYPPSHYVHYEKVEPWMQSDIDALNMAEASVWLQEQGWLWDASSGKYHPFGTSVGEHVMGTTLDDFMGGA